MFSNMAKELNYLARTSPVFRIYYIMLSVARDATRNTGWRVFVVFLAGDIFTPQIRGAHLVEK